MIPQEEVFLWKNLSIQQNDHVLKVGTDAILLGCWIPTIMKNTASILDVGTGTGILAMMLASAFPTAFIEAIDQDENAVKLAQQNFKSFNETQRFNVRSENLFNPDPEMHKKFELIVSNPPYYFEQYRIGLKGEAETKHAKHSPSIWIKALNERLEKGGHIFIIIPHDLAFQWIRSGNELGLYCIHRLNVFSFEKDNNPKRSLLHFSDQLLKPGIDHLILYKAENKFSDEYILFTGVASQKE